MTKKHKAIRTDNIYFFDLSDSRLLLKLILIGLDKTLFNGFSVFDRFIAKNYKSKN